METSITQLGQYGLLGILLVISLLTIGFLYRENKQERNARLADLKEVSVTNAAFIKEVKTYMENILSLIRIKK